MLDLWYNDQSLQMVRSIKEKVSDPGWDPGKQNPEQILIHKETESGSYPIKRQAQNL